jgi:tetratricopeptide (TPR) repeat protein
MKSIQTLLTAGAILLGAALAGAGTETTSGTIYNQNGQYPEAVAILKKAIAKDPKDAKAHFQIGFAYSKLDSVALAYQHFMKAKELDPKKTNDIADNIAHNYAQHYKLAQVAFTQEDFAKAAREFETATQADPTQPTAHYNLAVTYSRLAATDSTCHEKALAEADKVLALTTPTDPNYTKALQLAGRQLVELGREDEAIARFQRLVDEDPSKYQVIEEIGTELVNEQKWKGASVFLNMAVDARTKVGAEDFTVYYNLGVAEFNLRKEDPAKLDAAIASYEKALGVQPDEPSTVFNLMVAHMAKEDWMNAATWGEKYASISPSDAKAWQYLARCYSELGDKDKASDALARYQQLKSQ